MANASLVCKPGVQNYIHGCNCSMNPSTSAGALGSFPAGFLGCGSSFLLGLEGHDGRSGRRYRLAKAPTLGPGEPIQSNSAARKIQKSVISRRVSGQVFGVTSSSLETELAAAAEEEAVKRSTESKSEANGRGKGHLNGSAQKASGSRFQKVEWWRMDVQNGAQHSSEGSIQSLESNGAGAADNGTAASRRHVVGWMREAHDEEPEMKDGEAFWAWRASKAVLSNGSAVYSQIEELQKGTGRSHLEAEMVTKTVGGQEAENVLEEVLETSQRMGASEAALFGMESFSERKDEPKDDVSLKRKPKKDGKKKKKGVVEGDGTLKGAKTKKKSRKGKVDESALKSGGELRSSFIDENGAKVRMYPSPGYIDRLENKSREAAGVLSTMLKGEKRKKKGKGEVTPEGSSKKHGAQNGAVETKPVADNLAQRLKHLRRKAIEHKERHDGEGGTLLVPTKQPILVLMRHGQSMWNELKLFTGDVDIPLTEKGVMEALSGGRTIKDVDFDIVFTSRLLRAKQTAMLALTQNSSHVVPVLVRGGYHGEGRIGDGNRLRLREAATYALDKAACKMVPVYAHPALNERCYGDLQGLNKEEAAKEFGKELVQQWRRSNNTSPPGGESLVDTARRCRKYYVEVIEPRLKEGKNVLVVTHGNVMRGLIAYLASLGEEEMLTLEIATAFPYAYAFSRESGDYAQCCLMKPMEDFITGEPLEGKPMGIASVLKKKNFDSLI